MKVLLLCYRGSPFCGGQGIYLFYLSRELSRLGIEVDVCVGPPYPDPIDEWATVYKIENLNVWGLKTGEFAPAQLNRIFSAWNFIDYVMTRFHFLPKWKHSA